MGPMTCVWLQLPLANDVAIILSPAENSDYSMMNGHCPVETIAINVWYACPTSTSLRGHNSLVDMSLPFSSPSPDESLIPDHEKRFGDRNIQLDLSIALK
jgi:hypothetical protein